MFSIKGRCKPMLYVSLAMMTMRKTIHEFSFLSYMGISFHLAALQTAGAPYDFRLWRLPKSFVLQVSRLQTKELCVQVSIYKS